MSFPIIGNDRVRDALLAAISEKKIPHAILIEGDRGTGKHTLVRFLVSAALCNEDNAPCGKCKSCHLASVKTHPDIVETLPEDGKKNISVAQIRSIRVEAYVKPHMRNRRVFVIDKADTMNEQAQNALLKVLEEPPADIIFILIAESSAALLDTIISRCLCLSLVPPDISAAVDYLSGKTDYSAEQLEEALKQTGGNIGIALEELGAGGAKARIAAAKFTECILSSNEAEMLKIAAPFEKSRVEADAFLKELKLCVAAEVRKNHKKVLTAKVYSAFYDELDSFIKASNTNINLGLLFCALVSRAAQINK